MLPHRSRPHADVLARALVLGGLLAGPALAAPGDVIASPYDPDWADVPPAAVIALDHDPLLSDQDNGLALVAAIEALVPGERLELGSGTWSIPQLFNVGLHGTPSAPIWIAAQPGATPVVTRPNMGENVLNVGEPTSGSASYVALQGLEVTGGSIGIRVGDASQLWIDRCHVHDTAGPGITANTPGTSVDHLYVTRCEVSHTDGSGEGIRLGGGGGDPIVSESVVALNWVHDTAGNQGDGIEIGDGSWGNWIAENEVHDTPYPCLLAFGTGGMPVNVIERNVMYRSDDVVMQVQAEADVFNNLLIAGTAAFYSHQLQTGTRDIRFEHNTVLNSGRCVSLVNWNDKPGMTFVNNVCYSEVAEAVKFHNGHSGVTVAGNAHFGTLAGVSNPGDYVAGAGLADFENAYWDASLRNARPTPGSALLAAGSPLAAAHGIEFDLLGQRRDTPPELGCYEKDSWGAHYGWGEPGPTGQVPYVSVNAKPVLGEQNFVLFLEDGPPNQAAYVPWGFTPFQVPVAGGHLWLVPHEFFFSTSGAQGVAFFNLPIPNAPALDGAKIYFQWILTNPWSPQGFAFSEGLELTFSAF